MSANQPGYKFYVVNVQKICIDSGWEDRLDAMERAVALRDEGVSPGAVKVMTKPRVGDLALDPNNDACWTPRRSNPKDDDDIEEAMRRAGVSEQEIQQERARVAARRKKGPYQETPTDLKKYKERVEAAIQAGRRPQPYMVMGLEEAGYTVDEKGVHGGPTVHRPRGGFVQNPARRCRRYFGSEAEARAYLRDDPDRDEYQIRYRHINDDYVVEPRTDPRGDADENPRFGNPAGVVKTKRDERLWKMAKNYAAEQGREADWPYIMGIFQRMKQRVGGGMADASLRENPDSAKAEKVYSMWHQKEPHAIQVLDTGCDGDDLMICVGKAHNIVYRSGKWEHGKKTNDYVHHFDSKPSVYMLAHLVEPMVPRENPGKTVESLLKRARNKDGQYAVADLATPLSFGIDDGADGTDIAIHNGSRVYGAVDQRTVIIMDPKWKLIVIKGGEMHFDERGIVK